MFTRGFSKTAGHLWEPTGVAKTDIHPKSNLGAAFKGKKPSELATAIKHSDNPNLALKPMGRNYVFEATRHINKGEPLTANFAKVAKLRGRTKRMLRTFLAKNKEFWAHTTKKPGMIGILEEGIKPAQRLANEGKLKHIEGVSRLTKKDIQIIAKSSGGYGSIQRAKNPNLIKSNQIKNYPTTSVSFLRNKIPVKSNFGSFGVLGRMRQLNKKPQKIVRQEGVIPLSKVLKDEMIKKVPKAQKADRDRRIKQSREYIDWMSNNPRNSAKSDMFRGGSSRAREGMISKERPIKAIGGQNIMIAPKKHINELRRKRPDLTFVAHEDLSEKHPDLFTQYHRRVKR